MGTGREAPSSARTAKVAPSPAAAPAAVPAAASAAAGAGTNAAASAASAATAAAAAVSAPRYTTKTTTTPFSAVSAAASVRAGAAADGTGAAALAPALATATALPHGWRAAMDPASGYIFYCNDRTGSTTWERPAAQQQQVLAAAPVEMPAVQQVLGSGPWMRRGAQAQLPTGWTRQGPTAEGHFWYHGPGGETQWEPPTGAGERRPQLMLRGTQ